MWRGRVFQTLGAEMWKAREPNDRVWRGTKAAERKMNACTFRLCEAVRGLQGMACDRCVVLYKWVWRVWTWFTTLSGANEAVPLVGLIRHTCRPTCLGAFWSKKYTFHHTKHSETLIHCSMSINARIILQANGLEFFVLKNIFLCSTGFFVFWTPQLCLCIYYCLHLTATQTMNIALPRDERWDE